LSLPTRSALGVAAVAAAVLGWFFLAPPLLGGRTTYVVTRGISMEPRFHTGDLVLLRRRVDYRVGQIVAYRSDDLGRTVMHRVVGFDGTRYRFKGDNNDFVDTSEPTQHELIGRLWLRVPKVGLAVAWAADRRHIPFVFAAALALMLGGGATEAARRRRRPAGPGLMVPAQWIRSPEEPSRESPGRRERTAAPTRASVAAQRRLPETLAFPVTVAAAAFAALAISAGIIALTAAGQADTLKLTVPSAYTVKGTFSYAARVAPSDVYPSGRIATGDPIFVRLVPRVRFAFAYEFASQFPHGVRGTGAMDAVVSSPQGWQRTLRLVPRRPISGDRGALVATLDLRTLKRVLDRFQSLTGVAQSSFTVTLQPKLALEGGVAGTLIHTVFAPTAPLTLDEFQLSVAQPQVLGNGPAADPLSTSLSGSVDRSVPASFGLGVTRVSVRGARDGGGLVALFAALAAIATGLVAALARRAVREDEDVQIEREFADWIVPIASAVAPESVIEVEDMESLVQIAEHYERMILRERLDHGFAYLVEEGGTVYRYRSGVASPGKLHSSRFTRTGETTLPDPADNTDENSTGLARRR
jgi:signal peptidase I